MRHIKRQPSTSQLARRNAFRKALHHWKKTQTPDTIQRWQHYADKHPTTRPDGTVCTLTAINIFMRINLYRAQTGVPLLALPPSD